jgi:hypothetical protein
MTDHLDPWDKALLDAMDQEGATLLTLGELAEHSGISLPLLEALAREGFLMPSTTDPEPRYAASVTDAIASGMALVEQGLPLGELLDLARAMDLAMRPVAERAVEVFARFVRDSVEANAGSERAAAERLVEAFRSMLPATGELVAHHFRELLVADARRRLES